MHRIWLLAAYGLLAGCATPPIPDQGGPASVADVLKEIKSELAVYARYQAWSDAQPALPNTCGGRVSFAIRSVRVTLTAQQSTSVGGSGSGQIPSLPLIPSLSVSNEAKGAQTLTFNLYPKPEDRVFAYAAERPLAPDPRVDPDAHPVAAAIEGLRESLLATSNLPPCVSLTPPAGSHGADGPPDAPGGSSTNDTYQIGFAVTTTVSGGVSTPKILPFSLGVSASNQVLAANTITVTFVPHFGEGAMLKGNNP